MSRVWQRCEKLEEALSEIGKWIDAYPVKVFPEPSDEQWRRAHAALRQANVGIGMDAFCASMGRHCLKNISEIAKDALAGALAGT